jgi:hypothetical protein
LFLNSGKYLNRLSLRESLPCSRRISIALATKVLEMEPRLKRVEEVTGSLVCMSARPYDFSNRMLS